MRTSAGVQIQGDWHVDSRGVCCGGKLSCVSVSYLELVSSIGHVTSFIQLYSCREGGVPSQRKDYLPPDKQFLVTKNGT